MSQHVESNDLAILRTRWFSELAWLAPGLLAAALVHHVYLATHPYPAFGAGLYLHMAELVSQHGYRLPTWVPMYATRIPFSYPPLMFYVVAFLRDVTPLSGITIGRYLPGLVITAYLVPFYAFVLELRGSRRQAGVATFLLAVSPPVLQWHLSAGGIVRAPAALFTFTGLYTGLNLFRTHRRRWLVASLAAFTLTVLTHPVYTIFFVVSYLFLYASFDRSLAGLLRGAVVGFGGVLLASPWWGQVIARHGIDVYTEAAGTHGGIGTQLPTLAQVLAANDPVFRQPSFLIDVAPALFRFQSPGMAVLFAWFALLVVAAVALAFAGEKFLAGWFFLGVTIVSKPRFPFLVGSILIAVALFEHVLPALANRLDDSVRRDQITVVLLVLIGTAGLGVGTAYAAGQVDSHAGSHALPAFIDDDDVAAMMWARTVTAPSSEFAVLGDAAEWFPYFADREIAVGPWGVEWQGRARYQHQLGLYNRLSTCDSASCVTLQLAQLGIQPDYLYVPKGSYTVRGMEASTSPAMVRGLIRSEHYTLVYENEGVAIFRVEEHPYSNRLAQEAQFQPG